jgi:hypothetical protein
LASVRQSVPKVEDASGQQAPNLPHAGDETICQLTKRAILDRYQPAEIHCVSRSSLNWSSAMSAWTTFAQRRAPNGSRTWAGPGRGFDHRSAFREPFVLVGGRRSRWSSFLKFADLAGEPWVCLDSVPGRRITGAFRPNNQGSPRGTCSLTSCSSFQGLQPHSGVPNRGPR